MQNIYMNEKWQRMDKPDKEFVNDLMKYGDYVALDYNRLGLKTYLTISSSGDIDFSTGTDKTALGFLEVYKMFRAEAKKELSTVCSPLIRKHLITIVGIYLLLEKHGYIYEQTPGPNFLFLDAAGEEVIQEAQAELINLQLI